MNVSTRRLKRDDSEGKAGEQLWVNAASASHINTLLDCFLSAMLAQENGFSRFITITCHLFCEVQHFGINFLHFI